MGPNTIISRAVIILVDKSDTRNQNLTMKNVNSNYSINVITSVKSPEAIPSEFVLEQNYPNSFSTFTAILYNLYKQEIF
jgi:hypothetical protein